MSLHLPSRQLLRSGLPLLIRRPPQRAVVLHVPRRTLFNWFPGFKRPPPLDPLATEFMKRKPSAAASAPPPAAPPTPGDLAPSSIFADGPAVPPPTTERTATSAPAPSSRRAARDPRHMAAALDPRPHARQRWERKMLIRALTQRQRIGKTTLLARTERAHLARSHFLKTSVKKLMPLARQIAGKPLDDAIVQMRFSRKLAAVDVLAHLERARDEAVVVRGMGLGVARDADGAGGDGGKAPPPLLVVDKAGTKRLVRDRTAMYVDQAWVGRGTPEGGLDYRARGNVHRLTKPYTSISVVLKEEATRIRLMNEREEKRLRKKPWVPLPDRPIPSQRQYPLW